MFANLTPQKANRLFMIIVLFGFVVAMIGATTEIHLISVLSLIVMFGAVIFKVLFYRCPNCGKFLGRDTVKHCPNCESKISD